MVCRQMMTTTAKNSNLKTTMENNFLYSSKAATNNNNININSHNGNNDIDSIDFNPSAKATSFFNHSILTTAATTMNDDINCNIFINNVVDRSTSTPEDRLNMNNASTGGGDCVDGLPQSSSNSSASTVFYPNNSTTCTLKTTASKISGAKLRARSADYYPTAVTPVQEQQKQKPEKLAAFGQYDDNSNTVVVHAPVCAGNDVNIDGKSAACSSSMCGNNSNTKLTDIAPVPSCVALKGAILALYRLDDFELQKIGQGFFSEVYKVRHKVNGDEMVLKSNVMTSNRPNVLKEVQLMRRLKHPNVLRFKGVCVDNGQLHALTEYCNGGSLDQCIKNLEQIFPWSLRASLSLDIARGMQYVHGCGYIHRDLTSKNVLLQDAGFRLRAVIADFGLACKIPSPGGTKLEAVGTPYWMGPECLKDEWYNQKADVFSYGIILCEMIARIDADPDVMPRTTTFGLDYLRYSELCPSDAPVQLLELAFRCCLMNPNDRPSFDNVVPLALAVLKVFQQRGTSSRPLDLSPTVKRLLGGSPSTNNHHNFQNNTIRNLLNNNNNCTKLKRSNSDVSVELMMIYSSQTNNARSLNPTASRTNPTSPAVSSAASQNRRSPSSDINRALAHSMAAEDTMYKPSFDGSNPFAAHTKFAGVRKFTAGHFNRGASSPLLPSSDLLDDEFDHDDQDVVDDADLLTTRCCVSQDTPVRRANSLPGSPSIHSSWLKQYQQQQRYDEKTEQHGSCGPSPASRRNDSESRRRMSNLFVNIDRRFVESKFSQKKQPIKRSVTVSDPYSPSADSVVDDFDVDDEYELHIEAAAAAANDRRPRLNDTNACKPSPVNEEDSAIFPAPAISFNDDSVDFTTDARGRPPSCSSRDDVFTLNEEKCTDVNLRISRPDITTTTTNNWSVRPETNLHIRPPQTDSSSYVVKRRPLSDDDDDDEINDDSPSSPDTSCTAPWHPKCTIL